MDMTDTISISAAAVFMQGILSFLSPCVLPLVPLYIGYLSGGTLRIEEGNASFDRKKVMVNTFFFVLGICFVFFLLGLGATQLSRFLVGHKQLFSIIGGILILLFGVAEIVLFGGIRAPWKKEDAALGDPAKENKVISALGRERRLPVDLGRMTMSPVTALIMGFTFSFAWTPCIGPVLSGVLVMAAGAGTQTRGFLLIGLYTLGFILPFMALGLFTSGLLNFIKKHQNIVRYTVLIGGVLMIMIGVLMITGYFGKISGALAV